MYKTDKSDRGIFMVRKMHCARRTERARPGSKHNKPNCAAWKYINESQLEVFLYLSYISGEGFLNKVVNEQNVEIPLTFFAGKSFPRINKSN